MGRVIFPESEVNDPVRDTPLELVLYDNNMIHLSESHNSNVDSEPTILTLSLCLLKSFY